MLRIHACACLFVQILLFCARSSTTRAHEPRCGRRPRSALRGAPLRRKSSCTRLRCRKQLRGWCLAPADGTRQERTLRLCRPGSRFQYKRHVFREQQAVEARTHTCVTSQQFIGRLPRVFRADTNTSIRPCWNGGLLWSVSQNKKISDCFVGSRLKSLWPSRGTCHSRNMPQSPL